MKLQQAQGRFQEHGLGLAAVSYDSPEILADFARRKGITFPLLADPESQLLGRYDVVNAQATGLGKGMAHPGYFLIDPQGRIQEKHFEKDYAVRETAADMLSGLFPELLEGASTGKPIEAPHLKIQTLQSESEAVAGNRLRLGLKIELDPQIHVYAPGQEDVIPVSLELKGEGGVILSQPVFPAPQKLFLPALNSTVLVLASPIRLDFEVQLPADREFRAWVGQGRSMKIEGKLTYAACNETACFPPQSVPLSWTLRVQPLDLERAPESIRHQP